MKGISVTQVTTGVISKELADEITGTMINNLPLLVTIVDNDVNYQYLVTFLESLLDEYIETKRIITGSVHMMNTSHNTTYVGVKYMQYNCIMQTTLIYGFTEIEDDKVEQKSPGLFTT